MFKGLLIIAAVLAAGAAPGVPHYVAPTGTNNTPYLTWPDAATSIQLAVNVATNSETVWVTNGTYTLTNQIDITNGIIVQSCNGKTLTFVNGNYPYTTNRCFYIHHSNAVLDGFTISNGYCYVLNAYDGGGGVMISNGTVQNCTIFSNYVGGVAKSDTGGGGVCIRDSGLVSNCLINFNTIMDQIGGGGVRAYPSGSGMVIDCVISNNYVIRSGSLVLWGGGVYNVGIVNGTKILNNRAPYAGGIGVGLLSNCVVDGNAMVGGYAGGVYGGSVFNSTISRTSAGETTRIANLINCLVSNNNASTIVYINGQTVSNCVIVGNMGHGIDLYNGIVRNNVIKNNSSGSSMGAGIYIESSCTNAQISCCTIVSNTCSTNGGGIAITSTNVGAVRIASCIIYSNAAVAYKDLFDATGGNLQSNAVSWSCAGAFSNFIGSGNITSYPAFVNPVSGDYHLQAGSPCINRGSNETWMTNSYDLDGQTRIRYGIVDMGAYERINAGTIFIAR